VPAVEIGEVLPPGKPFTGGVRIVRIMKHSSIVVTQLGEIGFRRIVTTGAFMMTQLISCRLPKADSALLRSSPFHYLWRFVFFSSAGFSVGEEVPFPRPRLRLVHGTVPQKCARNTLPARSGILYHPAIEGLRCHPLLTSSTRAPEVTPN
jgi:hypothetical protein